jgi:hypothetical protein
MKEEWSEGIEFPLDCGLEKGEDQYEDGDGRYLLWCKGSISANQQKLWLQGLIAKLLGFQASTPKF